MPFSCTKRTFSADDPDGMGRFSSRDADSVLLEFFRAVRLVLPAKPMLWKTGMGRSAAGFGFLAPLGGIRLLPWFAYALSRANAAWSPEHRGLGGELLGLREASRPVLTILPPRDGRGTARASAASTMVAGW